MRSGLGCAAVRGTQSRDGPAPTPVGGPNDVERGCESEDGGRGVGEAQGGVRGQPGRARRPAREGAVDRGAADATRHPALRHARRVHEGQRRAAPGAPGAGPRGGEAERAPRRLAARHCRGRRQGWLQWEGRSCDAKIRQDCLPRVAVRQGQDQQGHEGQREVLVQPPPPPGAVPGAGVGEEARGPDAPGTLPVAQHPAAALQRAFSSIHLQERQPERGAETRGVPHAAPRGPGRPLCALGPAWDGQDDDAGGVCVPGRASRVEGARRGPVQLCHRQHCAPSPLGKVRARSRRTPPSLLPLAQRIGHPRRPQALQQLDRERVRKPAPEGDFVQARRGVHPDKGRDAVQSGRGSGAL
mmetsp:Transcript_19599/g.45094  ORF Transcript_19599/g.45094 Transcript_19599/m.45094 type:complete len:356 (-) Transcript_19599:1068-2135(-)